MKRLDENMLVRYLQKECSDEDFAIINDWLKDSEDNAEELFRLEEAFSSFRLKRYTDPVFLDKAEKRLIRRIEQHESDKKQTSNIRRFMKYAAVFAIMLGGVFGGKCLLNSLAFNKNRCITVSAGNTVEEVSLPDGTKVWLNRLSEFSYPKKFSKKNRTVYLTGEAYFEVAKDTVRPFTVHTAVMQVKALGTSFNLKSEKDALFAEATLIEGKVEVTGKRHKGRVVLLPGQKAELNHLTGVLEVKQLNARLSAVWRDGLIPFEHAGINEIAVTLEQLYQMQIILASDVDSGTYSGVLHRRENIDSVLNSLKNSIPINYKTEGNVIYISKAD